MIIRAEDLKESCQKILAAVDNNNLSILTETLELKTQQRALFINVTNREYFAQVKLPLDEDIELHATVNANLFLKLITQTTSDTIELKVSDKSLIVIGNGNYKLPLIFDGDTLLELPPINIENVTNSFDIDSSILLSILQYNSKELTKKESVAQTVQRLYYVDQKGAITFTSGACVNSFNLTEPVKLLLNNRLVKLFKLFKEEPIHFTLGYDPISDDIVQTKVRFESTDIVLTAILSCDDNLLNSVPVEAIRGRASFIYPYSISLNKDSLLQAINRLSLFASEKNFHNKFEFYNNEVIIYDSRGENKEKLDYLSDDININDPYSAVLDPADVKSVLETCNEQYLTFSFGNNQAVVISRGNISNIIPECSIN
jgi:hypothetical protein